MPIFSHSFRVFALYREPHESMKGFLRKRWSFWLALFSCIAFLVGNMVGQHGWTMFWKSVWGKDAEVQIVFTGTAPPLNSVPDPDRWNPAANREYNFSDVPKDMLKSLPSYTPKKGCDDTDHDRRVVSVDYDGDYDSGAVGCGSHPAADILVPRGTPVSAAMNGIVDRVEVRNWGFGNTVVIKHPNVPDPENPEKKTTLYSSYGHLGQITVTQGQIVTKGQQIAVSGQTGLATAPHLHFQIDRESAPFHPYWPFTTTEATEAGYSFMEAINAGLGKERAEEHTINPLAYVEKFRGVKDDVTIVKEDGTVSPASVMAKKASIRERVITSIREFFASRRAERLAARIAKRSNSPEQPSQSAIVLQGEEASVGEIVERSDQVDDVRAVETDASSLEQNLVPLVTVTTSGKAVEIVPSTAEMDIPMPRPIGTVASITILHDGEYNRAWEQIVLFARDSDGRFVQDVRFAGEISIGTAFGDAEFSPSMLTEEQFDDRGRAIVKMLPRNGGRRAIVPMISGAFIARGEPLAFNSSGEGVDEQIASSTVSLQKGGVSQ